MYRFSGNDPMLIYAASRVPKSLDLSFVRSALASCIDTPLVPEAVNYFSLLLVRFEVQASVLIWGLASGFRSLWSLGLPQ